MDSMMMLGALVVGLAGVFIGSGGWPIKLMKKYKYEHFAFISMLLALIIGPWFVTLMWCPNALEAYKSVDKSVLLKSNLFSLGWGIANVLCMMCFVRIGFSLTGALLSGVGITLGVMTPMIFKGSGLFSGAPDITSKPGLVVLAGAAVMLIGVILSSLAGFGRDKSLQKTQEKTGSFAVGFLMAIVAGFLSCGISFAFVYSQGPILAAMKSQGAGEIPSNFAVWAVGLMGGGLVNVLYPAWLMSKNKSWSVLLAPAELALALYMGIAMVLGIAFMGKGMLMLGALGASVGFGIQQAMQMMGGQAVGFISGEWKGVDGKPRAQIYLAITALIIAALIMAWGNSFAK